MRWSHSRSLLCKDRSQRGSGGMWTTMWPFSTTIRRLHHLRRPSCTHAVSYESCTGETEPLNIFLPFFCFSPYTLHISFRQFSVSSHPTRSLSRIAMTPALRLSTFRRFNRQALASDRPLTPLRSSHCPHQPLVPICS